MRSETCKLKTTKELFRKATFRFECNDSLLSDLRKQNTNLLAELYKTKYYRKSLKETHKYKLKASFFCFSPTSN